MEADGERIMSGPAAAAVPAEGGRLQDSDCAGGDPVCKALCTDGREEFDKEKFAMETRRGGADGEGAGVSETEAG